MRHLALLLFCSFFVLPAEAQDASDIVNDDNVRYNAFGVPEQTLRVIEAAPPEAVPSLAELPLCEDVDLVRQTHETLRQIRQQEDDVGSIYQRRRLKLALKNVGNFKEVALKEFRPRDNYAVAGKIMSVKMNEHIGETDLRLCAGNNPILKDRVYLLLRQTADGVKVDILNYIPHDAGEEPFFIYEQKKL